MPTPSYGGGTTLFEWLSILAYYAQLLLIGGGLWMMKRSSEFRDRAHEHRHEESMTALRSLIEQGDDSRQALRVLIERTAPQ